MIKHGKIYPLKAHGRPNAHIEAIKQFVTKGVADAKQRIVIQPMACDVKGAKRFNPQQCVIAKAIKRTYRPQAVAIGRSLAFAVFDGLAIRFRLPTVAQKLVQEFDQRGRARSAPVELIPVSKAWKLGRVGRPHAPRGNNQDSPKRRIRKLGVRAVGGGITA